MTLQVSGVSASYRSVRALRHVSLTARPGELFGIVGPNGAGKSTLLKLIAGVVQPDEGRVTWNDRPIRRGDVAYLPQRSDVDWDYPVVVRDVVAMGRYPHLGWTRRMEADDRAKVAQAMERTGITALADRPIGILSGGQQQRVFLARALTQEPSILLLDEPFAGIDAISEQTLWTELRSLRDAGVLVVVVYHGLTTSRRFDRMLLLATRVIAAGAPGEVLAPDLLEEAYGAIPAAMTTGESQAGLS